MGTDQIMSEGPRNSGLKQTSTGSTPGKISFLIGTSDFTSGSTITLTSTDGTTRKYVAVLDGVTEGLQADRPDGDPDWGHADQYGRLRFRGIGGAGLTGTREKSLAAAVHLCAAITSSNGHRQRFACKRIQGGGPTQRGPIFAYVEIEQTEGGLDGNTKIVTDGSFDNALGGATTTLNGVHFRGGNNLGGPLASNTMRGYLYGPPIEVAPVSGTVSYGVRPGRIYDNLSHQDIETYFAANLQDPAYQAYTPPYFYGESSFVFKYKNTQFTPGAGIQVKIPELIDELKKSSYHLERYDVSSSLSPAVPATSSISQGSFSRMKIDSSVDVFNYLKLDNISLAEDPEYVWYMNPKWVCPVLDFSSSYSSVRRLTSSGSVTQNGVLIREKELALITMIRPVALCGEDMEPIHMIQTQ
jgi:hypothetical protein